MIEINLRDFYPECYRNDYFMEVPEELAEQLKKWHREEEARRIMKLRYKAYYSLDRDEGIERSILSCKSSAEDEYLKTEELRKLNEAFYQLTDLQAKRIYEHVCLGRSIAEIAREEERDFTTIKEAIERSIRTLQKFF